MDGMRLPDRHRLIPRRKLEPDPKVVEQYQHVVIQSVFAKRWSEQWHGLVLPGGNIAGKGC
jgi:hypothetical protein